MEFDADEQLRAMLDPDAFEETLETPRSDAETMAKNWRRYRAMARAQEAGSDDALDPDDVERLVYDLAEQGSDVGVESVDAAIPDWRTRRWTPTTVLDLARAFEDDETAADDLLSAVHLAATTAMDHARRRYADAKRRRTRYVAESEVPMERRADLLERYEAHLQRQLASTLAMLRGVRESFTPT